MEPEERKENGLEWHWQKNITWAILSHSTVNSERCRNVQPYSAILPSVGFYKNWELNILSDY